MNWKRWKLGFVVSIFLSLLVAGAGLMGKEDWRAFIATFCAAALTHLGAFLNQSPIEKIDFDDSSKK